MNDPRFHHRINWFQATRRPTIFGLHVSIVVPILLIPIFFGWKIFATIALWAVLDIWLFKKGLTLKGAIKRMRLWARAGYRNVTNRRKYQKIKRGI